MVGDHVRLMSTSYVHYTAALTAARVRHYQLNQRCSPWVGTVARIVCSTSAKYTSWMAASAAALMSPLRSRNGPQARMVVEFLVELPNLPLAPCARRRQTIGAMLRSPSARFTLAGI